MSAHDHWTYGPVADRVGIVLVGLGMIAPPLLMLLWHSAKERRRLSEPRQHDGSET